MSSERHPSYGTTATEDPYAQYLDQPKMDRIGRMQITQAIVGLITSCLYLGGIVYPLAKWSRLPNASSCQSPFTIFFEVMSIAFLLNVICQLMILANLLATDPKTRATEKISPAIFGISCASVLINMFLFAWFIVGNFWFYGAEAIALKNGEVDVCESLRLYGVVFITVIWGLGALACVCGCFIAPCIGVSLLGGPSKIPQ